MKYNNKNASEVVKKTLNLTAQLSDAVKHSSKRANWKNQTNKMTEDDIDKLFGNHSKEKEKEPGPTKVSTEIPEVWAPM